MKKIMLIMLIVSPCFAAEPNIRVKQQVRFQQQTAIYMEQQIEADPQIMLHRVVPQQYVVGLMGVQVALGQNIAGNGEKTKHPHTNQRIIPKNQKLPKPKRYRLQQSRRGH